MVGSFCKNHIKFQLKKYRRLSPMTLKSDAKFKEKLTCRFTFKFDVRNLVNFHPNTQKPTNFTSMGCFFPKCMMFELKNYRGLIFHDTERWWKIWINPDLVVWFQKWLEELGELSLEHPKVWKLQIDGLFLSKAYILFQLENFRGIMCHDTEWCCKV